MASFRKRGKVWYYRFVDADGIKRTAKGCSDKRATEDLARDAEAEAAKIRAGLVDAKDLARRDHQARPLSEHLDAWRETLLHEGNTPKHADQTADRVRRLIAVMFGARPDDIDGKTMSRVQARAGPRRRSAGWWPRPDSRTSPPSGFKPPWRRSATRADRPKPATTIGPASALSPDGRSGPAG